MTIRPHVHPNASRVTWTSHESLGPRVVADAPSPRAWCGIDQRLPLRVDFRCRKKAPITKADEAAFRDWILAAGITPHASAHARLVELAETTRRFQAHWSASLRAASLALLPEVVVELRLVLGEGIGDVKVGMGRAELPGRR